MEIELKFQVPAARRAALRKAVAGAAGGRRETLRALYVDTVDERLAAAGLALRLRREGRHWVQALKGRGDGVLVRLEHEVTVDGAATVPPPVDPGRHDGSAAGVALRRALRGSIALEPRFGTEIRRTRRVVRHGGSRIELAFDEGVLVAGNRREPVCELELELKQGDPAALIALAERWCRRYGLVLDATPKSARGIELARGALPAPVRAEPVVPAATEGFETARRSIVRAALAHALANAAPLARGQGEAEHLHQLRLALRRLRTVLRAWGAPDPERDEALAMLFDRLGQARDADVVAAVLAPAFEAARAAGVPTLPAAPIAADALGAASTELRAPRTSALWLRLLREAWGAGAADAADTRWAPAALAPIERLRHQVRRGTRDWTALGDEARHRLRRRLKRLRDLMGCAQPLFAARPFGDWWRATQRLAEALGRCNDLVVAQAGLAPGGDPGLAFVAGWLARERERADRRCAREARRWRALSWPRARRVRQARR